MQNIGENQCAYLSTLAVLRVQMITIIGECRKKWVKTREFSVIKSRQHTGNCVKAR